MANKKPETIAARANGFVDTGSGGVVPPLQPSTTFIRDPEYKLHNPDNTYGRDHNDQVRLAEDVLNTLEGGAETLLFSSGMAAISTLAGTLVRGQKLLLQQGIYWGTTQWMRDFCEQREIGLVEVDASDSEKLAQTVSSEKPDMVFIETPSNPWLKTVDIEQLSSATTKAGALLVVDSTAATPILSQPLNLGADFVVHSATKALNGHSDVLAGSVTCRNANAGIWAQVKKDRHGAGAILSAYCAWLLIRGMRTLALRIGRMSENALAIALALEAHEKTEKVWYPGLKSDPGHEIASRQMHGGYGYLMSFLVKGGKSEALEFCRHLEGIHRATSLGGVESLVEHRHTVEGELTGCPENLIRLSVGIESVTDLLAELDAALKKI